MKTLIFDFDGTIADSFETLLAIFEDITARPQKLTAAEIKNLRGSSLKEIVKYLKIRRWQIPKLVIKAKRQIALKMPSIKTFKGMPEVLNQLHGQNYKMFILSTNNSENISKFLKTNGLDDYFVKIYGDIGLRSKASALKKIMKKEKQRPSDCIYIGDEVRDVLAAKRAGIKSIAVSWGFNFPETLNKANPDFLAKTPEDISKYLTS